MPNCSQTFSRRQTLGPLYPSYSYHESARKQHAVWGLLLVTSSGWTNGKSVKEKIDRLHWTSETWQTWFWKSDSFVPHQRVKNLAIQILCCFNSLRSSVKRMLGIYLFSSYFSDSRSSVWPIVHSECLHPLAVLQQGTVIDTAPASMELTVQ